MLSLVAALFLQQTAPAGQAIWSTTPPPAPPPVAAPPPIPDSARADPYGYERAQCSPLIRDAAESLEACQARVRSQLAAHLGEAAPAGLTPGAWLDACRQEAAGDRYALQCGSPSRAGPTRPVLEERVCETRPQARPDGGGVNWVEDCRPASGRRDEEEGLRFRLGGD